jgi:hypothetical protein
MNLPMRLIKVPTSELHAKFCADYSNEDQPAIQKHKSQTLSTYEILISYCTCHASRIKGTGQMTGFINKCEF